jgi:hypothetical protein
MSCPCRKERPLLPSNPHTGPSGLAAAQAYPGPAPGAQTVSDESCLPVLTASPHLVTLGVFTHRKGRTENQHFQETRVLGEGNATHKRATMLLPPPLTLTLHLLRVVFSTFTGGHTVQRFYQVPGHSVRKLLSHHPT